MALSLNGFAHGGSTSGTVAATLTTTLTNDTIVACIVTNNALGAGRTVTGIASAAGLTWSQRASLTSGALVMEIWSALSPGALTSEVITATLSGAPTEAVMIVFGGGGVDTTYPWEARGSVPVNASSGGASVPTVAGVSTNAADTMLIGFMVASSGGGISDTAGSGFTEIDHFNTLSFSNIYAFVEYKIVSSQQSSVSVATTSSHNPWFMIADALVLSGEGLPASTPAPDGAAASLFSGL